METSEMTSGFRNVYECIAYEDVPREVPASYKFVIEGKNADDKELRRQTYAVTQKLFNKAKIGYYYNHETGQVKAQ